MNTDTWGHTYEVFIGRGKSAPAYGHYVPFPSHPGVNDPETFIRNSKVEWTTEGVNLILERGHKLFIPKGMFIGGR